MDSLIAPPVFLTEAKGTKILGMIGDTKKATVWRQMIAKRPDAPKLLEEKLVSWAQKPTAEHLAQASRIANHIVNLAKSDSQESDWLGIAEDEDDIKDEHCYVPSLKSIAPTIKHTPESLMSVIKFGAMANTQVKRRVAEFILDNIPIILPHHTAQVKNFQYRILLKDETPFICRKRQSPVEVKFLMQEVNERIAEDIVCETTPGLAPYVSPPLIVPKKDSEGVLHRKTVLCRL